MLRVLRATPRIRTLQQGLPPLILCQSVRTFSTSMVTDRNGSDRWGDRSSSGPRYGSFDNSSRYGSNPYGKQQRAEEPRRQIPLQDLTPPPNIRLGSKNTITSSLSADQVKSWRLEQGVFLEGLKRGAEDIHPILTWEEAPFHERALKAMQKIYPQPLAIQSQGWSISLNGHNMIGCANTGSGKTLAFVLPALEHIKSNAPSRLPSVLVLAPSRELAQQIDEEFQKYAGYYGVRTVCLFGGQGNRNSQLGLLRRDPQVIVATPGRLNDFCDQGIVNLKNIHFLVLDEADRMLEMGFEEQVRDILNRCPPEVERQTQMWTATWPKAVQGLTNDYFSTGYVKVVHGSDEISANPDVEQKFMFMQAEGKLQSLIALITKYKEEKIIVFASTKMQAAFLETRLAEESELDFPMTSLHGDKTQSQRNAILEDFKKGILRVVVATDVASRGLDVKDIKVVVNYDMPQNIESYIHRIGRTARAGKKGVAYSFFTPGDSKIAQELVTVLQDVNQTTPPELVQYARKHRGGGSGGGGQSRYGSNPYAKSQGQQGQAQGRGGRGSGYGDSFRGGSSSYRQRDSSGGRDGGSNYFGSAFGGGHHQQPHLEKTRRPQPASSTPQEPAERNKKLAEFISNLTKFNTEKQRGTKHDEEDRN